MKHARDQVRARPSKAAETPFFSLSTIWPKDTMSPAWPANLTVQWADRNPRFRMCRLCGRSQATNFWTPAKIIVYFTECKKDCYLGRLRPTIQLTIVDLVKGFRRDGAGRWQPFEKRTASVGIEGASLGHNSAVSVKERKQWTISSITIRRSSTGQNSFGRTARGSRFTSA